MLQQAAYIAVIVFVAMRVLEFFDLTWSNLQWHVFGGKERFKLKQIKERAKQKKALKRASKR